MICFECMEEVKKEESIRFTMSCEETSEDNEGYSVITKDFVVCICCVKDRGITNLNKVVYH